MGRRGWRMNRALVLGLGILVIFAATAQADVIYGFTGTPFGLNEPQTFTFTTPDFISDLTVVLAGQLDSCTGTVNCVSVTFDPAAPDAGLLAPADEILFASSNAVWNFFFPDGAFTTVGEYDNLDPSGNVGHLSVQVTAVPEPTTVSLFALGAAVAAVRVRRWQKYVPKKS